MRKAILYFSVLLLFLTFNMANAQLSGSQEFIWKMEAEDLSYPSGWKLESSQDGHLGDGYISWAGPDYFNEPNHGTIAQKVSIPSAGTYRFIFRSKIGNGDKSTDFNDTWVKILGADAFYGKKLSGEVVYPHGSNELPTPNGSGSDGWFKAYLAGSTYWTWSTNTSDDDGHQIVFDVFEPKDITILLATRSKQHLIDQIAIYKIEEKANNLPKRYFNHQMEGITLTGESKQWHKLSLTFDGPLTSESSNPNPFMDYRLDVVFTHEDGTTYQVPGFYAACGEAAFNWCNEGNKWRVNFSPDRIGYWEWQAFFKEGKDIAVSEKNNGTTSEYINGSKGAFEVTKSDKKGKDFRSESKGRLKYVGEHFLRFSGSDPSNPNGDWFYKAGADATENTLDFEGFQGTPNKSGRRKNWNPHAKDFKPWDADDYNWGHDHGSNLLGMISYLSSVGMNVFSFLTFSASGDDENVFPHLLKVPDTTYQELDKTAQWSEGIYHDRFDCSKLDQWEQLFRYADKKGIYLHFKLGEEENECKMDGGKLGRERKAYYRELVARFSHHLALNWNIGEENGYPVIPYMTDDDRVAAAQCIQEIDPYENHIVLHTRPDMKDSIYSPLLGNKAYTGASLQSAALPVHDEIVQWIRYSNQSGHKWIVTNDEQGTYQLGVSVDEAYQGKLPSENLHEDNRKEVRSQVLWGTLMAGGAGVEYYYGYESGCTDLNCQDHRTRSSKWNDAKHALDFFTENVAFYIPQILSSDDITNDTTDYVLKLADEALVIYQPIGKSIILNSKYKDWFYFWFDPITGNATKKEAYLEMANPPSMAQDWVFMIKKND